LVIAKTLVPVGVAVAGDNHTSHYANPPKPSLRGKLLPANLVDDVIELLVTDDFVPLHSNGSLVV